MAHGPKSFGETKSLERRVPSRKRKVGVFVYSEGEVTERYYIEDFFSKIAKESQVVLLDIADGAGSPDTIVKACVEHEADDDDTIVWAVFDVDEHKDLNTALARAREHGIPVSLSDPCFELWGLLHEGCCDKPMTRKQAQRALAKLMPGFHHDKSPRFDWSWCEGRIPAAIKNAESSLHKRLEERLVAPKANPSSNFHYLLLFALQRDERKRELLLDAARNILEPPTKKPAGLIPAVKKSATPPAGRKRATKR